MCRCHGGLSIRQRRFAVRPHASSSSTGTRARHDLPATSLLHTTLYPCSRS